MQLQIKKYKYCIYSSIWIIIFGFSQALAQSENVEISPNVVKIDAERLGKFSQGYAIVSKGSSSALIDAKGTFIIPFNKYWFYDQYRNGMLSCSDLTGKKFGYLDINQKLAIPLIFNSSAYFNSDGYASNSKKYNEDNPANFAYSVTKNGIMFPFKRYFKTKYIQYETNGSNYAFHEEFIRFDIKGTGNESVYGFINRVGEVIIDPIYIYAEHFSEGMAPVLAKNDQGQQKWGFINKKGITKIPFIYSNKPEGFKEGLSLVEPISKEEFDFAYINNNGDIIIKIASKGDTILNVNSSGSGKFFKELENSDNRDILTPGTHFFDEYGHMKHPFQSGIAFWEVKINNNFYPAYIEKSGKLTLIKDVLATHGIISTKTLEIHPEVVDGVILFSCDSKYGMFNARDHKIILQPVFSALSHFDPVSKLAYAVKDLKNGGAIKGYIDTSGNFKIIKEERTGM